MNTGGRSRRRFGGLELTTILSRAFGDAIDIVLVDMGDAFVFGSRNST